MGAAPNPSPGQPEPAPPANNPTTPTDPPQPGATPPPATTKRVFSESEVQQREEAVRREEKQKLYADIEAKEGSIKELKRQIEELNQKVQAHPEQQQQAQQEINTLTTTIQSLQEQVKEVNTNFRKTLDEALEAERQRFEQARELDRIDAHKQATIKAANGEIIEELVVGTTIKEIDESAERAKTRYKEIRAKGEKAAQEELDPKLKKAVQAASPGAPAASSPTTDNPNEPPNDPNTPSKLADYRKMTPDKWKEHRKAIIEQAAKGLTQQG